MFATSWCRYGFGGGRRGGRGYRRGSIAVGAMGSIASRISRLAKGLARRHGREESARPQRPSPRCSIRTSEGPREGFDVLLAGLVVEVLDAPFCATEGRVSERFGKRNGLQCLGAAVVGRSTEGMFWVGLCFLPGTASRSSSFANFMTAAESQCHATTGPTMEMAGLGI